MKLKCIENLKCGSTQLETQNTEYLGSPLDYHLTDQYKQNSLFEYLLY